MLTSSSSSFSPSNFGQNYVGVFPELEEQLTTWVPGERSPDRMDALVWAVSALFYPTGETEVERVVSEDRVTISPV